MVAIRQFITRWIGILFCGTAIFYCSRYVQDIARPSQRWHVTDYLVYVVIILAGTLLAILQAQKARVNKAAYYLQLAGIRMLLRFFLAFIFFIYGFAKILDSQFFPLLYRSDKVVHDLNGMDKTWIFFGHSIAYKYFIGYSQIFAAILLCFRRTSLIGLLFLITIVINIVFINFAFDIPVKFDSVFYLCVNVYLLSFYLPAISVFIKANPGPGLAFTNKPRNNYALYTLIITIITAGAFWLKLKEKNTDTWKTKLYGIYDVRSIYKNGFPDSTLGYKTFYFDISTLLNIRKANNTFSWNDYAIEKDDSIMISGDKDFKGKYKLVADTLLELSGTLENNHIEMILNKRKKK